MAVLGVLYVCGGNILRSPVAERIANQEFERHGLGGTIKAESAGLYTARRYLYAWEEWHSH